MAPVADGDVGAAADDGPDIRLSRDDRIDFLNALARAYRTDGAVSTVFTQIGYPLAYSPVIQGSNPEQWWTQVFIEFDNGIIVAPFRTLLYSSSRRYPGNEVFQRLAARHLAEAAPDAVAADRVGMPVGPNPVRETPAEGEAGRPAGVEEEPAAEEGPAQSCHVIVRASSEPERRHAQETLARLGLEPHEFWSTSHAVSYRVSSTDTAAVRERLDGTDLGWTLVPPGEPDYVLQTLYVGGPDGRQFRLNDAPAQQTVENVAASVMEEYPPGFTDATRSIVVDEVQDDGSGRRLNTDDTLHVAGIRNNSRMRIGVEARAGALNPKDRQEALHRVRNQIVAYARAHPGFQVRANSGLLPTEYELEFAQPSFGPGAAPGDDPVAVDRHVVLIQLGAEFPETPPLVFWLTPLFHPNVFPNYDCDQARE
ncbi:effector-associated domain EAD1-containing protein, partial [Frankia sp. CiP1_Cm_nod2]|uniref:effector-associated domain EAD1-containing protein n=1 Tax=Frankia sp. CiP1_Cm_nod2 TaxID=2897161 RepID=UPI0020257265